MPPVTFAQTRRSFGARPTTGQTQGPAGMGGPPPQQQQSVDPILNAAAVQAANQAAQQSDPIPGGTMVPASSNPFIQRQQAGQSMFDAGIANIGGKPVGGTLAGAGGVNEGEFSIGSNVGVNTPVDDEDDDKLTEEEKKEKEKKDKALETAKELTNWWKKNGQGYRAYGDRKTLGGKVRNSQANVSAKIQDKLNKGYYKIVNQTVKMKDGTVKEVPMIIHASTGTMVNPYTGGIISTQTRGDQGGAYQNEMARITGIAPENAGVFSKEYQTGNGLSVGEMKPEHALRFLMKKNKGAFEQFFNMNKDKAGFNPFSVSTIGTAMGAILNKITGPEALQVGNNLERAGWGKAIKGEDGKYTIKLTKEGAENWSNSFNFDTVKIGDKTFTGFTSPEAIAKDKSKGFLSEILGTKKFPDQPIDLSNLIEQGGYQQGTGQTMGFAGSGLAPITQVEQEQGFYPTDFKPVSPQSSIQGSPLYSYPTDLRDPSQIPGTPPSQYPQFTPEGYKIGAYNPSMDYSGGTGQTQTGGGGGGSGTTPDPTDPNNPYGNLTFDVYGRPIKKYDYTGGPEQLYLGGGWKKDGSYIGSPWGFKNGGIANFKPYGY